MKFLITIFLLIHFNNLKAQDYYCVHDDFTIFGIDTINRTADRLKQGVWWEFELGARSISCFVSDTCYSKQYVDYVSAKGNYDLGKRTGEWFIFYPSGTLKRKVNYSVNGELDGALIDLYLNGKEKSLRIYKADTLISGMEFFENGGTKFMVAYEKGEVIEFTLFSKPDIIFITGGKVNSETREVSGLKCFNENSEIIKCREKRFDLILLEAGLDAFRWN